MKKTDAIALQNVNIHDGFWSKRQRLVRDVVIPYQWDALNDRIPGAEPSHTIENFRIAAGESEGSYYGMVFQDSDLSKWLETVGFQLSLQRDEQLERLADETIALIGRAQREDGYLNTYFTVKKPGERWTNLRDDHELYCAGHFIEAAVAYHEATGKRQVLDIACAFADHIGNVFGPGPDRLRGYDGHPEIELALVKLYKATGSRSYLELSKFFVEERGRRPHFFDEEEERRMVKRPTDRRYDYFQAHLPVREQHTAEGHSVRAVYLYSGMADLAAEYGDAELLEVCRKLWHNVTRRRMYITGGIGSSAHQERFTVDYDLPADRAYAETCASIGLVFWAQRMLEIDPDREYADVIERALYNGLLSGISLDGKSYFYVNPLEVWPSACNHRHDMKSVKTTRQPWFGCACCPPNISRLIASLGRYIYSSSDDGLYVHQYIGSTVKQTVGGVQTELTQTTGYPWHGQVTLTVSPERAAEFAVAVRLPGWCKEPKLTVNGAEVDVSGAGAVSNGYAKIRRVWEPGDRIELTLPMEVEVVRPNPHIRDCAGKVALQRGPVVYCLEEADNGSNLRDVTLSTGGEFIVEHDGELLGGVTLIRAQGWQTAPDAASESLYTTEAPPRTAVSLTAIPYFAWANRGEGEMLVWVREA
nr:beta-L-arabinofuranosidase domain-containing protein [Paenibacillus hamazuiensis]